MTKPNEQYAYFTLAGDFNPDEVSERIGIAPSRMWAKGEINPQTHFERKTSRWSLDSRLERSQPLEAHVRDVLAQLSTSASDVRSIADDYGGGTLQLVAYFYTSYPGFGLDRETIGELARLGLDVDCDFYYHYSDAREDS